MYPENQKKVQIKGCLRIHFQAFFWLRYTFCILILLMYPCCNFIAEQILIVWCKSGECGKIKRCCSGYNKQHAATAYNVVEMRGITRRGPCPSAVLRLPFQSAWTIGYSRVHRTCSLTPMPFRVRFPSSRFYMDTKIPTLFWVGILCPMEVEMTGAEPLSENRQPIEISRFLSAPYLRLFAEPQCFPISIRC